MQKNTQATKEAHTELRNCKQEIKEIKKFNDFRSMMNKMSNKRGEKYTCLLTELNLHNKGVQENNKLFFFMNTSEQHKETLVVNLIYFSDRLRLITHADNKYGNTVEPPIRRHTK